MRAFLTLTRSTPATLATAALVFALGLTGCQTSPSAQAGANALATGTRLPPQVTAAPGLERWLQLGAIATATNAGGLMAAQVTASTSATQPRAIDYRFEWLDANGQVIPSVLSRDLRLTLYPGATQTLSCVAPSPSAVDFRLHLKPSP